MFCAVYATYSSLVHLSLFILSGPVALFFYFLEICLQFNIWRWKLAIYIKFDVAVVNGIVFETELELERAMWEEGINTKPQIYYNNKNASIPQASKRKKGKSDREIENTHAIRAIYSYIGIVMQLCYSEAH